MKLLGITLRALGAAAALGCLALAGPAAAGGLRYDSPDIALGYSSFSWGAPVPLGFVEVGPNCCGGFMPTGVQDYSLVTPHGVTSDLYVYQNGVVGLEPITGDPSTLGGLTGDFFAPALGINAGSGGVVYMEGATVVTWSTDGGDFQVEFDELNPTTVGVTFSYCSFFTGDCSTPPESGFKLGKTLVDYGAGLPDSEPYYVADLTIASSSAAPEPGTWTVMIIGFGAAGSLLRRRRAVAAS
jgi:hypothetical protein